jgi:hypothetical protein
MFRLIDSGALPQPSRPSPAQPLEMFLDVTFVTLKIAPTFAATYVHMYVSMYVYMNVLLFLSNKFYLRQGIL